MLRWTSYLAKRIDEICDLGNRETAKPKGDVLFELLASLEDIKWAALNAERVLKRRRVKSGLAMINFDSRVEYLPLGVVGVIAPWNAPLYTVFCGLGLRAGRGQRRRRQAERVRHRDRRLRRRVVLPGQPGHARGVRLLGQRIR